jgi:hypothetical protein
MSAGKPWYREPWPWLLMAGPAAVIVAGVITTWIAFSTFDGLVAEDYYRRGLNINATLACEPSATRPAREVMRDPAACRGTAAKPGQAAR